MRTDNQRESSNVEDRRGVSKGAVIGGGLGAVILAIVVTLLGGDPSKLMNGPATGGGDAAGQSIPDTPEAREGKRFVSVVLADTEDVYCALDVTDQPTFSSFARFWDNGKSDSRLAELTGLQPQTTYMVRMQCGAAVVFATFQSDPAPEANSSKSTLKATSSGDQRRIRILDGQQSQLFPESFGLPAAKKKKKK